MKNQTLIIGILTAVVLGVGGYFFFSGGVVPSSTQSEKNGFENVERTEKKFDTIPEVELEAVDGSKILLHNLIGKPLVINSWAAWCPFCVDELPDFVELQSEFGDVVAVVAINRRESVESAGSFLSGISVSTEDLMFLYDRKDSFYQKIGGFSMPETLFVDADGT